MIQQKILAQGAEAKIILSNNLIIKDRISKSYRLKELDEQIRKRRTKSETKLLQKAHQIIPCPLPSLSKEFDKIKSCPEDLLEEEVYKEFDFILCPRCKEIYCANPLHLPLDNLKLNNIMIRSFII